MRRVLATLAAAAMLGAGQVYGGALAPAPQLIAEYGRSFIERSGAQTFGEMLDTGIIRYFFTGGRELLILVNGRPYTTTAGNLDSLPLSAIERIEVLRAESLGTLGGRAAVRGAFNLVLRKDLDGLEVRTVARMPSRDGGDARQGSAVWGGAIGNGGHLTVGVDILDREEIAGSTREHSRSEWTPGGSFAEAKNVSLSGNTLYIYDVSGPVLRSVPLGECDPAHGYTGPLSNPPGIRSGDKGCGFAYGSFWWDTASYDQRNAIVNLDHPLGERAELRADANVTQGSSAFRYAPSVDVFSFSITDDNQDTLLAAINTSADRADPSFQAEKGDFFSIGHRFIGHGNRDWRTDWEEYEFSASVEGQIREGLGYDARVRASFLDGEVSGDTFVHAGIIREEIAAGRYDLANPLSTDPDHLRAIEKSSLSEERDFGARQLGARFALEGTAPGLGSRETAWTAGVELFDVNAHSLLAFRGEDGRTHDVNAVLGSGGTSYEGERDTVGAFAEVAVPLGESVDVRAAGRTDSFDDVGGLHAWRLGAVYRPTDIFSVRGSVSTGDSPPSMADLHSTAAQDHPYVRCIPDRGPPPRKCDSANYRQVTREMRGNPDLEPSGSERLSFGAGVRKGPMYAISDWYKLTTSDLPGTRGATWAILNYPECSGAGGSNCIQRAGGDITIHDSFSNVVEIEVSGVNTRFGHRAETSWGFLATRVLWRHVTDGEVRIAGEGRPYPLPRNAIRIVNSVGRGDLTAFWAVNYRGEIENEKGDGRFNAWTGHDVTLDWKRPLGIESARVTAGVYNVTDEKLSTNTANPATTDGPRAAGWGRTFFVTLNMQF